MQNDIAGIDAGAVYLYFGGAVVDTVADLILTGETAGDNFGASVAAAGDVNGDGFADVIIGASGFDGRGLNSGRAYLYLGGQPMNTTADLVSTGASANDCFGNWVSSTGDVNADGYSDILIGAKHNDEAGTDAGRVYLYLGGNSPDSLFDATMYGASQNDVFGYKCAAAGDVNNDGYDDFLCSAPGSDAGGTNSGAVFLYTNTLTGFDVPDNVYIGEGTGHCFGRALERAGDVNGDGYEDFIIGAYGAAKAYLYFGGPGRDNIPDVVYSGEANSAFGSCVAAAGDVNGDGYADVIIGANHYNSSIGRAYLYYGGASPDNLPDLVLTGESAGNLFGSCIAGLGDFNGDGYDDIAIGAPGVSTNTGRVYLYFGGSPMNGTADLTFYGENISDYFGILLSKAGDVNGDGYADLYVAAIAYSTGISAAGKAYIYFGGASPNTSCDVSFTGSRAGETLGWGGYAGDVNGDGYDDIIIGGGDNNGPSPQEGRAYLLLGGAAMDGTADLLIPAPYGNKNFGNAAGSAGDVNNDGYNDFFVGAPYTGFGAEPGRVYIYFGGKTLSAAPKLIFKSNISYSGFGLAAGSPGDVNGDGISDMMVGAYGEDNATGKVYLYLSSPPPAAPRITSVQDVPDDQGGFVKVRWNRSAYDAAEINQIAYYAVERSDPPVNGNYAWQTIAAVAAINELQYQYNAPTPSDSMTGQSGTFFFRVTAHSTNAGERWKSNILSGHSIDNLAPAIVQRMTSASSGNRNRISWKPNAENDLFGYAVYRASYTPINPDTCSAITIVADTLFYDDSFAGGTSYYFARAKDIHGNYGQLSAPTAPLIVRQLKITAIPEGFFDSGTNVITADTITVQLRQTSPPYTAVESGTANLSTSANAHVNFRSIENGTGYYLAVKHRNSIETWSKQPQHFTNSTLVYDMTASADMAYGNNLVLKGTKWCIYGGDVNQDGIVDYSDLAPIDNGSYNFLSGYVVEDITGDDFVDYSDLSICDNNSFNFISAVTPLTGKRNTSKSSNTGD
jgi:hypothetical protein